MIIGESMISKCLTLSDDVLMYCQLRPLHHLVTLLTPSEALLQYNTL